MKANLHPTYYQMVVSCACGNKFTVGGTQESMQVEVCSACHPYYTGKMKFLDTAGRVDTFKAKQAGANTKAVSKTEKRRIKREKRLLEELSRPDTLEQVRKAQNLN